MSAEVDANLGDACVTIAVLQCGQLDAGDEILLAVGAQLSDGQL